MPFTMWAEAGLSPRVRGNRGPSHSQGVPRGSIPACAGEPGSHRASFIGEGVYPRVCGGTTLKVTGTSDADGLSPRVRGNRFAQE